MGELKGLDIQCDYCPNKLKEFGALLFSPPTDGKCEKKHICVDCYRKLSPATASKGVDFDKLYTPELRERIGVVLEDLEKKQYRWNYADCDVLFHIVATAIKEAIDNGTL